MNDKEKRKVRIIVSRLDAPSFTDIRTAIAIYKFKKSGGMLVGVGLLSDIYKSSLSWQQRKEWVKRCHDYKVAKKPFGQNLEWLTIRNNSEEIAKQKLKAKADRVSGKNNPGYQHGGKFSPFSKKFVAYKGLTEEEKQAATEALKERANQTMDDNDSRSTTPEYYMKRFGVDMEEAKQMLSERQSTFSLDKCIERYGEEAGRERWLARQEKWLNTLNQKSEEEKQRINLAKTSNGYCISKAEQELLNTLKERVPGVERQLQLKRDSGWFMYDIYKDKKIIEYNGDYWHCNPNIYSEDYVNYKTSRTAKETWEFDELKLKLAKDNGYEVLVIWETDYKKNKTKVTQECITFLTQ